MKIKYTIIYTTLSSSNFNQHHILNKWDDYEYNVIFDNLSDQIIKVAHLCLYESKLKILSLNHIIIIQFKIKDSYSQYKYISRLQTVKLSDFELLFDIFSGYLKSEEYYVMELNQIVFTFKVLDID